MFAYSVFECVLNESNILQCQPSELLPKLCRGVVLRCTEVGLRGCAERRCVERGHAVRLLCEVAL